MNGKKKSSSWGNDVHCNRNDDLVQLPIFNVHQIVSVYYQMAIIWLSDDDIKVLPLFNILEQSLIFFQN